MNKCFLYAWRALPHHAQRFFPCRVINVSAFSRTAAGVQTCALVWRGSVARGVNAVQRWGERRQRGWQWGLLLFCPHIHSSILQAWHLWTPNRKARSCPYPTPPSSLHFILLKKLPPYAPVESFSTIGWQLWWWGDYSGSHKAWR